MSEENGPQESRGCGKGEGTSKGKGKEIQGHDDICVDNSVEGLVFSFRIFTYFNFDYLLTFEPFLKGSGVRHVNNW
jgi:hypothetical protein